MTSDLHKQQATCRYAWLLSGGLLAMAAWPLDGRHFVFAVLAWLVGSLALARFEFLRVWISLTGSVPKLNQGGSKDGSEDE